MKGHLIGITSLLCCLAGTTIYGQVDGLRINEIMAVNDRTLADEDGDFSDWIELYNAGTVTIDLTGWSLSDDSTTLNKWGFPAVGMGPSEYLVIFASGKDRAVAGQPLHTNFKLSGDGEYLALLDPSGSAVSAFDPAFPPQQADFSYGYFNGAYLAISNPTPGSPNTQSGIVLSPPEISVNHGIFQTAFDLEIQGDVAGGEIFYTLDGSVPDISNGTFYTAPILINTTTILRAVQVLDDTLYSNVVTRTYLFLDDVIRQTNNPPGYPSEWGPYTAIPGTAIADYEMDPEMMADPDFAASVIEGLESLPTISVVTDMGNLFSASADPETGGIYIYTGPPLTRTEDGPGKGWERPASVEYFTTDGTESFQADCGLRLQGGHSRRPEKSPKHSFRLVFKSDYGPSRLEYPIFKDEKAGTSFNTLILRAGFGLSWIHHSNVERIQAQYQRDIWTKDTQRAMGYPSSHSEYVHLYLNGIYWGIYAPSERMDSDFAAEYLGGSQEEYDVIKDYQDVANGEITGWNKLMEMANAGLEGNDAYQAIQGKRPDGSPDPGIESMVDVKNLADYMLINFYGGNTDWDHHNWAAMRNREDPGTGFKFFCWDAEHMLKAVSLNVLDMNNDQCPSRVFQQLRANDQFRLLFADRIQRLCFNGGILTPQSAADRWLVRTSQVEQAIPVESARWGDYRRDVHPYQTAGPFDLYNYEDYWVPQHEFMVNTYFPNRTAEFLNQLREAELFPQVAAPRMFINGITVPVEEVSIGDVLTMTSEGGVIYFTTNGSDPVDWNFQDGTSEVALVAADATKKVLVPKSDIGDQWRSDPGFDDGSWLECNGYPGGIGYEIDAGYQEFITLDVGEDMHSGGSSPNTSCYIRIPFTIGAGELESKSALFAKIRYDDGFAIFLNGVRVAEVYAPMDLQWNSTSTDTHEAISDEVFDLSDHIGLLKEGENLLAIQALNRNLTSSDFLITVELVTGDQAEGEVSDQAAMYSEPVILDQSGHISARTFLNGSWSALMSTFVTFPEDYRDIKLTEIHYNPLDDESVEDKDLEFIELKNVGSSTMDLAGIRFTEGVAYTFPPESQLTPGGFVVLASDQNKFFNRYGMMPQGEYSGNLNNGGDRLRLESPQGDTLFRILYDNNLPWPQLADGGGHSLVPVDLNPSGDQNGSGNWRDSYFINGSPGRDDTDATRIEDTEAEPAGAFLSQNYPNPFTTETHIHFSLSEDAFVDLSVFNLMGQKVAVLVSGAETSGSHVVSWDGLNEAGNRVENGIYFYRIMIRDHFGSTTFTRKMIRF